MTDNHNNPDTIITPAIDDDDTFTHNNLQESPSPEHNGTVDEYSDNQQDDNEQQAVQPGVSFTMPALPDLRNIDADSQSQHLENTSEGNQEGFTTVYDIIDRINTIVQEGKRSLLFPHTVRIPHQELSDQLEELKAMLPVQLERASALMREAERRLDNAQMRATSMLSAAQNNAAQTLREAQDQAQFLISQEHVTDLARQQARSILDDAQQRAHKLTQGADQYCTTVMQSLQEQLDKLSRGVSEGIRVLEERQNDAAQALPQDDGNHSVQES